MSIIRGRLLVTKIHKMVSRIIPLVFLLFMSIIAKAQTPQRINIQQSTATPETGALEMACADQFAGTISFDNFIGESNDIDLDTIYLCFGDQIDLIGNGDADLTGDPNPLTEPGITYGFYDCPPTIAGPDLDNILMDNCIIDDPVPAMGITVTAGGDPNGDILFSNTGLVQNFFNDGDPILVWFAPITVDDFGDKQYEGATPMTAPFGPCTNVNTDAAFAVVYLNEIEATNMNVNANPGGCLGTFDIEGGLPEFDGSDYDINIQLLGNPAVTGTVMAPGGVTHGDMVTFSVPEPGIYGITITDEKGCPETFVMDFSACQVLEMEITSTTIGAGSNVCVEVNVLGGFNNITALSWSINFDETILAFTGAQSFNPNVDDLNNGTLNQPMSEPGSIIFTWFTFSGQDLPDGSLLYELCFDAIGLPGNCSPIGFSNDPTPGPPIPIEVVLDDAQTSQIGFEGTNGQVCLDGATITLDFMQTPVTCMGDSDGSFTVDINGGTAPYDLSWQAVDGGPTQGPINVNNTTFTTPLNQSAGCYSVTVMDATSAAVDTVCVEAPPGVIILLDENPPLCNGEQGTIVASLATMVNGTLVAITDLTDYDFLWSNNSANQSTGLVNSGFYSVTVTEPNGCTATNSTVLTEPTPFDIDINITPASCSGIDDGAISILVSGATPDANNDYLIEWTSIGGGLTVMNNTSNVTGLEPNGYPLMITDDNGCVFNDTIFVTAIKTLSVNAIVQDVLCAGTNTGSISAFATTLGAPADEPYTFNWFGSPPPPAPTVVANPNQTLLEGLGVGLTGIGTYNLIMTDAAGCELDTTFIINEPDPLEANLLAFTPESCDVGGDGTATLGVTGGTYPYSYDWGPGIMEDSTANSLSAGMYIVTVSDANLCEDTVHVTIDQPIPPVITMFEDATISCPGNMDGMLTVVVDNPANIIEYTWTDNVSTTEIANGLGAGTYFVTVTANNGCETVDTAMVIAPEALTLDSVVTMPPLCPGGGSGQISIFVSGGTGPYFFDWPTALDIFDGVGNATASGPPVMPICVLQLPYR